MSELSRLHDNHHNQLKKRLGFALTAIIISVLVAFSIQFALVSSADESRFWPGWFVLELPAELDDDSVSRELSDLGIVGAVTKANVDVGYMAIPDVRRVSLNNLDQVLPVGDPRRDPYLNKVSELFESDGFSYVYLPSDRSIRSYKKIMESSSLFQNARILDNLHHGGFGSVLLFVFLASLLSIGAGKRLWFRILSSIVWMPIVYSSPPELLFPILLIFWLSPACAYTTYVSRSRLSKVFSFVAYLLGLYLLLKISSTQMAVLISAALCAELIMISSLLYSPFSADSSAAVKRRYFLRPMLFRHRDHVLFEPVSLLGTFRSGAVKPADPGSLLMSKILPAASVAAVLLALLAPLILANSKTDIRVPSAGESLGSWSSPGAFQRLRDSRTADNLMDAGHLLASAAYQEGFLYGAEYRVPLPGEKLTITTYREEGNLILAAEETVVEYDESWFLSTLERELSTGAGRLFASQDGPASVTMADVLGTAKPVAGLGGTVASIIAICMNLALMLFADRGKRLHKHTHTNSLTTRRRAQAA